MSTFCTTHWIKGGRFTEHTSARTLFTKRATPWILLRLLKLIYLGAFLKQVYSYGWVLSCSQEEPCSAGYLEILFVICLSWLLALSCSFQLTECNQLSVFICCFGFTCSVWSYCCIHVQFDQVVLESPNELHIMVCDNYHRYVMKPSDFLIKLCRLHIARLTLIFFFGLVAIKCITLAGDRRLHVALSVLLLISYSHTLNFFQDISAQASQRSRGGQRNPCSN